MYTLVLVFCRQSPNKPCSLDTLGALGVLAYRLTQPDSPEMDPRLAAIKKVRGYTYEVSPHLQAYIDSFGYTTIGTDTGKWPG